MKRLKTTPCPYSHNYGHQQCWNEGYRQALLDIASYIIVDDSGSWLAIDIAQAVAEALVVLDPRTKYVSRKID